MTYDLRARRACAVLGWDFADGSSMNTSGFAARRHGPGDVFTVTDRAGTLNARATVSTLELAATLRDWSPASDGHEGARKALADLAAQWREHLHVLVDWMLAHGEIGPLPMSDLESWRPPYFRKQPTAAHEWLAARWKGWAYGPSECPHVPFILTQRPGVPLWIEAMFHAVTEECPKCAGHGVSLRHDGGRARLVSLPWCPNCKGLGRVRGRA